MSVDEMWYAVLARDSSSDNKFVLAVRTTGIYCRPSCPSRHPKIENVEFFPNADAAEAAGYRSCLRCKPRDSEAPQMAWVRKTCDYIRRHPEEALTLPTLGQKVGISAYHLQRTFKRVIGVSPHQYQETCRIERLKGQLRGGKSVKKAVYDVGYGSASWLYKDSTSKLGMTPGTYRRKGEGMKIRYRIVETPLGKLILATTHHGVCYLGLWDKEETLEKSLRAEYPSAEIARVDGKLDPWTREILDYLDGRAEQLGDIPVDVVGTSFQYKVWRELQSIPRGQTRTYSEVANSIGSPKSLRAVGRVCATNPVSLLIPCHRVLGKSGDLRGYHWGLNRKKLLLDAEKPRS